MSPSPMHKFGYRFTETEKKHERDIVRNLRSKLEQERSLRRSIVREVDQLKNTLNSFKQNAINTAGASLLPPTHPKRSRQPQRTQE